MKLFNWDIVFEEVPDETTLALNISNCPYKCKGCHSPFLQTNVGDELTELYLLDLINKNDGITCIAFMGGDRYLSLLNKFAKLIKSMYNLKVAWYSGRTKLPEVIDLNYFDFIKLGPYIKEFGGLDSKNTNQKFYKIENNKLINLTFKFQKL